MKMIIKYENIFIMMKNIPDISKIEVNNGNEFIAVMVNILVIE